ncbi:MAG: phosphate ABC transporter permease [Candidatus Omnitrophica bacterium CG12_big_fil_rev_8_21_14_0_65_43_15]|uniref:Transport permease protein n=1 Tax=Candidatus Taenaricola geysiri TaxID=1974752 RepID=A0A2J0LMY0_9BACT|nr:MAG: phosphate ABC transporter permease [Candidatus Omnitrophica bacterium CG1_02_43_210]PIV11569.1 MAG: phosphate ABC transporter permease [Candidatus Omnitrophica bacterium CG03_land_8_20_14_0_80_43_22]PIW66076.1 MAG: phosphate ABC transporter permease [Candidatus Omnitrophica bacterium CG12_big_fil_rev_8_21_14_0_65_43_15]PIW80894.1 MAG: phosphate ABC transporter permease [Candidatus Omnitrophica bacterium CG_4_8_14_3_um_filter_43_15]PIY84347.1 MAG: phosphate ABC transporter permease [Cand
MEKIEIKPADSSGLFNFRELWSYRELLYFLVWRNIKARYSQTAIGVLWVVIQPLMVMLIFSVLFGRLANLPSEGLPYTVFVFSGLLPWNLIANAVSGAGSSLIMNRNLVAKVYFPRIIIPLARVLEGLIDFGISCCILFCLILFYKIIPARTIVALPFFILWTIVLALGVGFWLSALNVRYKDVAHIMPFLSQIWFYVSPVAYTLNLVPEKARWLYSLNPMVGIIEGFRWSLFARGASLTIVFPASLIITAVIFITGLFYFYNSEKTFADII